MVVDGAEPEESILIQVCPSVRLFVVLITVLWHFETK